MRWGGLCPLPPWGHEHHDNIMIRDGPKRSAIVDLAPVGDKGGVVDQGGVRLSSERRAVHRGGGLTATPTLDPEGVGAILPTRPRSYRWVLSNHGPLFLNFGDNRGHCWGGMIPRTCET